MVKAALSLPGQPAQQSLQKSAAPPRRRVVRVAVTLSYDINNYYDDGGEPCH